MDDTTFPLPRATGTEDAPIALAGYRKLPECEKKEPPSEALSGTDCAVVLVGPGENRDFSRSNMAGTGDAIKFPPPLGSDLGGNLTTTTSDPALSAQRDLRPDETGKEEAADATRGDLPEYNWATCSRKARMVLEHMRRSTPKGAAVPWRSRTSVTPIQRLFDDGCELEDLLTLVDGAAQLVAKGTQSRKWWYPANVFGSKTVDRWLADIAELREGQERAQQRQNELRELDEAQQMAQEGPLPQVQSLTIARLAQEYFANRSAAAALDEAVVGSSDDTSTPEVRRGVDRPTARGGTGDRPERE